MGGKFEGASSYAAHYEQREAQDRREKVVFRDNEIMPRGQFEGASSYQSNYLFNDRPTPSKPVKQQQQLSVGGKFEGSSNYAANFDDKGLLGRPQKAVQPLNKFFPEGKFDDATTYAGNYVENPVQRSEMFRPEGELKVGGGVLENGSSYNMDYVRREGEARQRTVSHPVNDVMPKGSFKGSSTYAENYDGSSSPAKYINKMNDYGQKYG